VLVTTQNRYVGVPYLKMGGLQSFLHETDVDALKLKTREEAEWHLNDYLNPKGLRRVSSFRDNEKLKGILKIN
jgi:hypothetical protein